MQIDLAQRLCRPRARVIQREYGQSYRETVLSKILAVKDFKANRSTARSMLGMKFDRKCTIEKTYLRADE